MHALKTGLTAVESLHIAGFALSIGAILSLMLWAGLVVTGRLIGFEA